MEGGEISDWNILRVSNFDYKDLGSGKQILVLLGEPHLPAHADCLR